MSAAERSSAAARIATMVAPMLTTDIVALYAAKPGSTEVDTVELEAHLRNHGLRVAYPRVVASSRVLEFAEGPMQRGAFGLLEPSGPALPLADISTFVIPGIAFDREGNRIGWGGGYYDATLAAAAGFRIGLAFDCQIIETIPRDVHDIGVDLVVTETTSYRRR